MDIRERLNASAGPSLEFDSRILLTRRDARRRRQWVLIASLLVAVGAAGSAAVLLRTDPGGVTTPSAAWSSGISLIFVGETPDRSMGPISSGGEQAVASIWRQLQMPGHPPELAPGHAMVFAPVFGECTAEDVLDVQQRAGEVEFVVSASCARDAPEGGAEAFIMPLDRTLFVFELPADEAPHPSVVIR